MQTRTLLVILLVALLLLLPVLLGACSNGNAGGEAKTVSGGEKPIVFAVTNDNEGEIAPCG